MLLSGISTASIPAVFHLAPIEKLQGRYNVIQLTLLFKDSANNQHFDPIKELKSSFGRLVEHYPILQGHVDNSAVTRTIQIDETDLEKQLFFGHVEAELSIEEFECIKYHRKLWPSTIRKLLSDAEGQSMERLSSVVVVKFTNGYLVSLSVSHIITDVAGLSILLEQWASLSKDGKAKKGVDFDHEGFWNSFVNPPVSGVHPYYEHTKGIDAKQLESMQSMLAKLLETHSTTEDTEPASCILHVPKSKIDMISQRFNHDSRERPIHGIQLLYAILWQRYAAIARRADDVHAVGNSEKTFLTILHNSRNLVDGAADYVGNCITPMPVAIDSNELETMSVLELAKHIKSHFNTVTPGAAADFAKEITRQDGDLFLRTMVLLNKQESRLTISNISRLPFFDIDFGTSTPEAVLWGTQIDRSKAILVPLKDGGVDVYLNLDGAMFKALHKDRTLSQYCRVVDI
ncbi:hypothetical protein GGI12_005522 [Dipsacomyces acuminosporus]|nr:hypothetical protein GGI12_005522 [Dipsacomyces acuminosporus]